MIPDTTLTRILPHSAVRLFGDLIRVAIAISVVLAIVFIAIYYRFQGDHLNDFRVFYYSTQAWLAGQDMYGPTLATSVPVGGGLYHDLWNMNPPHFHLVLVPFALLPLPAAKFAWVVINLACLVASLIGITRTLNVRWTPAGILWTIFFSAAFSATGALVATGQLTWMLMVPVTFAWIAARTGHWKRAAVLLGIAASVKAFFGVFLIYFLVIRRWREAAIMLIAGAAVGLAGLAVFGVMPYTRWVETLQTVDWPWAPMNASVAAFLARALSENPFFTPLFNAPGLIRPLGLVLVALLSVLTFLRVRSVGVAADIDRAFAALLMLALLVSPLGWIYYFWLAAGPCLALFWVAGHSRSRLTTACLLVALPGLVWPLYAFVWTAGLPLAAVTFGSVFFWTTIATWVAVTIPRHLHAA